MQTTKQVLSALRAANAERRVSEDLIRSAIRRELVAAPRLVAGRFLWTREEVERLAAALHLDVSAKVGEGVGSNDDESRKGRFDRRSA